MKHLILIQCPDKIGLVAAISNILAIHRQNIIAMREFVDSDTAQFFARIECAGEGGKKSELITEFQKALGRDVHIRVVPAKSDKKTVVLVTKEFHCLQDILVRNYFGLLDAEICGVISNHNDLESFTERFSIPFHHVPHADKTKEQFEAEVLGIVSDYAPDYLVLAKFMRILSPAFIARYPNRVINIHHSFLPAFIGANPYQQAFERGVKVIGATAHFVTADLDDGPIIAQETKHVNHNYNSARMRTAGREIERSVLNKALDLVFSDRVFITGNKTVVFE